MGPRSFERGNEEHGRKKVIGRGDASMGPRSFERGNIPSPEAAANARPASMGPRSFERGNGGNGSSSQTKVVQLQWGRAHSSAEIDLWSARGFDARMLQWGRAHSSAEITFR